MLSSLTQKLKINTLFSILKGKKRWLAIIVLILANLNADGLDINAVIADIIEYYSTTNAEG